MTILLNCQIIKFPTASRLFPYSISGAPDYVGSASRVDTNLIDLGEMLDIKHYANKLPLLGVRKLV